MTQNVFPMKNQGPSPAMQMLAQSSSPSPALSKRSGQIVGVGKDSSPVTTNMAALQKGGSGGSRHSSSERRGHQTHEDSDPDLHEYAYAYHTPLESLGCKPHTAGGHASLDKQPKCNIVYPRLHGYSRPLNGIPTYTDSICGNRQPRNLASHILNPATSMDRAVQSSLYSLDAESENAFLPADNYYETTSPNGAPRESYDNTRLNADHSSAAVVMHQWQEDDYVEDGDEMHEDEDDGRDDAASSLYAEAHNYNSRGMGVQSYGYRG